MTVTKRDQVTDEGLKVAINNARVGLAISMGVGKTLIGLRYLEYYLENMQRNSKFLVVAPKRSIFNSWMEEAVKHGIDPRVLQNVTFTTYLSLNKHIGEDYDIVVLDELHSIKTSHLPFLRDHPGRILGLTGTPPRYPTSERGMIVAQYAPIKYKYITDDAIDDNILNDYRIIVHRLDLGHDNDIQVKLKTGSFYTSESKNYTYWTERYYAAREGSKSRQIASIMRMKAMMEYPSKERYTKHLLEDIEEKCIVFCNTQIQAERLCKNAYHSKNPESEKILDKFKKDKIDQLSCVLQLSEGVNIPNLKVGVLLHSYGNERKASQRIGRLLRLNPDDVATIHILCYRGTVDERWISEALKDLDQTKIKQFNIKLNSNSKYESTPVV